MKATTILILLCIPLSSFCQNAWKDVYSESAWEERDSWQKADSIIQCLRIGKSSSVADIGAHEGYFSMKLSKQVGPSGIVYAVDISRVKLEKLEKHARVRGLNNVRAIVAEPDDPKIPVASIHAALIVDTYHEIEAHDKVLQHLKSALKPGGRLIICEPIADKNRNLSRDEQEKKHELGLKFALADLQKAGFLIVFQQENFVDRTMIKGDKMWIIVAQKPTR